MFHATKTAQGANSQISHWVPVGTQSDAAPQNQLFSWRFSLITVAFITVEIFVLALIPPTPMLQRVLLVGVFLTLLLIAVALYLCWYQPLAMHIANEEFQREITERRAHSRSVRADEGKYSQLFHDSKNAIFLHDPEGNIIDANAKALALVGYTESEILSVNMRDLPELSALEMPLSVFERVAKDGLFTFQARLKAKDGSVFPAEISSSLFEIEGQAVMQKIVRDITSRKQAEMEMQERERLPRRRQSVLLKLAMDGSVRRGDLEAALRRITETAGQILGVERVGVWLYNEDRSKIVCRCLHPLVPNSPSAAMDLTLRDHPNYFRALESCRVIAAHDACTDYHIAEFWQSHLAPLGITSRLDAAIRVDGRTVGAVSHERIGPSGRWQPEEENFARSIADIVALVLERDEYKREEAVLREKCTCGAVQATSSSTVACSTGV